MTEKEQLEILSILDNISSEAYKSTNDIAKKCKTDWIGMLRKLFCISALGYIKFTEIETVRNGTIKTSYAWKKLVDEEHTQNIGNGMLKVLNYVREDNPDSTSVIAGRMKENANIVLAKLLYLEYAGYVSCFRVRADKKIVAYTWKKLNDGGNINQDDKDERQKRYRKECFR